MVIRELYSRPERGSKRFRSIIRSVFFSRTENRGKSFRNASRLRISRQNNPPGLRDAATFLITISFSSSGKYPKELNRCMTQSNSAGDVYFRASSQRYCTATPYLFASSLAISRKSWLLSTPVTSCPKPASRFACLPCPQARSRIFLSLSGASSRIRKSTSSLGSVNL